MCMIMFFPKGINYADRKELKKQSEFNPHGIGYMYVEFNQDKPEEKTGNLIVKKFLSFDLFYKEFSVDFETHHSKSPFVVHFRLATQGTKDLTNCHPFYVNEKIGFVHNGIITKSERDEKFSDTYIFNEKILKPIGNNIYTNEETKDLLLNYVGEYNKLVFLRNDGEVITFNENRGEWKKGIWFSNKSYSPINTEKNIETHTKKCKICNILYHKNYMFKISYLYGGVDVTEYVCKDCSNRGVKFSDLLK
jgi:predicted glutamine amidotransferase